MIDIDSQSNPVNLSPCASCGVGSRWADQDAQATKNTRPCASAPKPCNMAPPQLQQRLMSRRAACGSNEHEMDLQAATAPVSVHVPCSPSRYDARAPKIDPAHMAEPAWAEGVVWCMPFPSNTASSAQTASLGETAAPTCLLRCSLHIPLGLSSVTVGHLCLIDLGRTSVVSAFPVPFLSWLLLRPLLWDGIH